MNIQATHVTINHFHHGPLFFIIAKNGPYRLYDKSHMIFRDSVVFLLGNDFQRALIYFSLRANPMRDFILDVKILTVKIKFQKSINSL